MKITSPHKRILLLPSAVFFLANLFFATEVIGKDGISHLPEDSPSFWQVDLEDFDKWKKRTVGEGWASWYGGRFHGQKTANGERYNKFALTCASRTLPFGTLLRITNMKNGKSAVVRVNDRGPYRKNRVLDVSYGVAKKLGFVRKGITKVSYAILSNPH